MTSPGAPATVSALHPSPALGATEGKDWLAPMCIAALRYGASDLHISVGSVPMMRRHGSLVALDANAPVFTADAVASTLAPLLVGREDVLERDGSFDAAWVTPEPQASRWRVNVFRQRQGLAAVLRAIPANIPPMADLGLPSAVLRFAGLHEGLVLVTGPTGSGKSTTCASLVDHINRNDARHIVTIEDPIEFIHSSNKSMVNQREIGSTAATFASALRHALRQDPDVVLVGEMRDLETISVALTAAETGHLVLGTLHTKSAEGTATRVIDAFPPEQQEQVRIQFADCLAGIVTQRLVPRRDNTGRVAAFEVLVATPAVRNLMRENKLSQIPGVLQTGAKEHGMQTMEMSLAHLVRAQMVERKAAEQIAGDQTAFDQAMASNL